MWKYLLLTVLGLSLLGCSTLKTTLESTDTFAVCKTADVVTTYVGVNSGTFVEANPIVAKLLTHGWLPWIALSAGLYWALVELDNKTVTTAANIVTCGVVGNNLYLLVK